MKNSDQFEQLLKQTLSPTVEPSEALDLKIMNQLKEKDIMKPVYRKKMSLALIVAILILTLSITTFAAWHILNPRQVAEHLGDQTLSHAFDDKAAIEINKTILSGGYSFTLLGIVSGEGLSDFWNSAQDVHPERTYAVVSITKQDGSKMPATQDEEYGKVPFFISPLIKGQKPWQLNIASMNGGYSELVIDGVMYRLIECDGVEIFADRGLYLCISTSNFYDINAFNYNEETGEISQKTSYNGANALFDLPLDITKADYNKAEKYLKDFYEEPSADSTSDEKTYFDWRIELSDGEVIPESIKEVTYDENGLACYEYEGHKISAAVDSLFEAGQTGVSDMVSIAGSHEERTAVQFSRDENGIITGRVIKLK